MSPDDQKDITFELVRTIIGSFSLDKILLLNASTYEIFGGYNEKSAKEIKKDPFYSFLYDTGGDSLCLPVLPSSALSVYIQ